MYSLKETVPSPSKKEICFLINQHQQSKQTETDRLTNIQIFEILLHRVFREAILDEIGVQIDKLLLVDRAVEIFVKILEILNRSQILRLVFRIDFQRLEAMALRPPVLERFIVHRAGAALVGHLHCKLHFGVR